MNAAQAALEKVAAKRREEPRRDLASGGIDRLKEYWNSLSPDTRDMLVNSAIGSLLGGGLLGGAEYLSAAPGEKGKTLSSAVMGAVLGALAGGGGTAGYKALTSGRQLPGEIKDNRPPSVSLADATVGKAVRNPLLTLGALGGGYMSYGGAMDTMANIDDIEKILKKTRKKIGSPAAFARILGKTRGAPLRMLALPAGLGIGYLGDRYLFGDY